MGRGRRRVWRGEWEGRRKCVWGVSVCDMSGCLRSVCGEGDKVKHAKKYKKFRIKKFPDTKTQKKKKNCTDTKKVNNKEKNEKKRKEKKN